MIIYACNPNPQETETGGLPQVQGQTGLHWDLKFCAIQNYKGTPCLSQMKTQTTTIKNKGEGESFKANIKDICVCMYIDVCQSVKPSRTVSYVTY